VLLHDFNTTDKKKVLAQSAFHNHQQGSKINAVQWSTNSKACFPLISLDLLLATAGEDGQLNLTSAASGQRVKSFGPF
jgi:aspartate ammonia-lyase